MNFLVQYIAAALLNSANHSGSSKARLASFVRDDYELYRGSIGKISEQIKSQFGSHVSEEDVEQALVGLQNFAAAEPEFSPAARAFWNIKFDNFRYYFMESEPSKDDDPEEYAELKTAAEELPILMAYARNGSAYIEDAIDHIAQMSDSEVLDLRKAAKFTSTVPASDRIVRLNHNQKDEIEAAATELVDLVDVENGIDGDPVEKELIVGQLKAGRELIRAQAFRAHLLYSALITALGKLIEKYGTAAIGTAAKKLLELLIENVFK